MKTPEEKFAEIRTLEEQKKAIENEIAEANKELAATLAQEAGLKKGDRVKLKNNMVVILDKFRVGGSSKYDFAVNFQDEISEEKYQEFTKRKFALHAECYATKENGEIDKRIEPKYNLRSLEDCETIKG